jgi:hypothetical protein
LKGAAVRLTLRDSEAGCGSHREKFLPALAAERLAILTRKRAQRLLDRLAQSGDSLLRRAMGAAQRLGDDLVDDREAQHLLRRETQRFGGILAFSPLRQRIDAQPSGEMTE